jgi:hypothetical protein
MSRLRNLKISNVGPSGNLDGIKLSGLDDFSSIIAASKDGAPEAGPALTWWAAIAA